jgi:hypothetical protein
MTDRGYLPYETAVAKTEVEAKYFQLGCSLPNSLETHGALNCYGYAQRTSRLIAPLERGYLIVPRGDGRTHAAVANRPGAQVLEIAGFGYLGDEPRDPSVKRPGKVYRDKYKTTDKLDELIVSRQPFVDVHILNWYAQMRVANSRESAETAGTALLVLLDRPGMFFNQLPKLLATGLSGWQSVQSARRKIEETLE